jgi:hypothetical protein
MAATKTTVNPVRINSRTICFYYPRIGYMKTSERTDALGTKLVFIGVLEDSTYKAPFVSLRISYPVIRNSVYKFSSSYVHQFEDKSLLLVVTEHTKIEPRIWRTTESLCGRERLSQLRGGPLCHVERCYYHGLMATLD